MNVEDIQFIKKRLAKEADNKASEVEIWNLLLAAQELARDNDQHISGMENIIIEEVDPKPNCPETWASSAAYF